MMTTRRLLSVQVEHIRERARAGVPVSELARDYGISRNSMRKVVYGLTYRDIPGALPPRTADAPHPNRRLTHAEVRRLRASATKRTTLKQLSKEFGICISSVVACLNYETYADVD